MAIDEALLEFAREIPSPVLRLYSWSEPAASFGFFQRFREVEQMTPLRPLIRRPTGGGVVPHDQDWTYSLVFPPGHTWHALRATESYQRVHEWVRETFQRLGVKANLAPEPRQVAHGQCFIGAEQFDVVLGQRKIAGAAQRRNKCGLLIQGSVQSPAGVPRDNWESALCALVAHAWQPFTPPIGWDARMHELIEQKYSRREYNERR